MRASFAFRVRIIALALLVVGLILIGRLYTLQVLNGEKYHDQAESQYAHSSANYFDRGSIFFTSRNGSLVSAATLDQGFTVALVPNEVANVTEAYATVSRYIEIDGADFLEKAKKKGDPYEELARRVPRDIGLELKEADVPGIQVIPEKWRLYPGDETAAQTIGFLGYGNGDVLTGQYGLERFYNEVLMKPDTGLYVNFFADIFTGIRSQLFTNNARAGADVVTSIEPNVQTFLQGVLTEYQSAWNPAEVGAIILDPHTGAIVALATLPSFNPNNLEDADAEAFSNRLVERVYEFGSIVKPLTVAAGIDAGVITPASTYNDKGFAVYDGSRISNFDGKGRGVVSMQEVLSQSLNTGVAHIVEKLGTNTFRTYLEAYGIHEETGIDLPNEAEPLVSNLESPRTIEYVTASFGQGIAVSPVSMARSLATLANHGKVPSLHVVDELVYPGGVRKKNGWAPERVAIKEESAEAVTRMLVEVVDTSLRGGSVKIPELSVAAKTGTAQIANPNARGYYDDRYLHSFFGYFPAYDAQFLVFLYAVAPNGARYASETWTAPFMETVRFLVSYYDIQPDRATLAP